MIRPSYAITLARTKLRSKRGLLLASIIVASLLFAVLIAIVIVFTGAEKSASEFVRKAGNDHYLVRVAPFIPGDVAGFSLDLSLEEIREIRAFEKKYFEDLRATYKSLGLEYDEASEISALQPAAWKPASLPEEQRVAINFASPVIEAFRKQKYEEYAKTATNKFNDLKQLGDRYGASGYYIESLPSTLPSIPGLRLVQDGREDFGDSDLKAGNLSSYGYYTNAIHNGTYSFVDQRLLDRYLLTIDSSSLAGIPVVVSVQEAASLFGKELGIGQEPEAANEKRAWLKEVQTELHGHTYQVCYRNSAELALLDKIQRDYADMENNKNTEGYRKPALIYEYPAEACGDITVKEDTRTRLEKQADARTEEMQKKLGTYVAPEHRLFTFQIVGFQNAQPYVDYSKGIDEYVKSLLSAKEGASMTLAIPLQMYAALPDELKIGDIQQDDNGGMAKLLASEDFAPRVLEFATVDDARAFLDSETCPSSATDCDKQFLASPYGSNYLILDEIGKLFGRVAGIAFPAALGLAALIIWFTISRIMAENRKETAVYRAMGAKRRDVTAIYVVYVLLVALRIALVSLVLGIVAALAVDYFYGKTLTDTAVSAFGIVDYAPLFSLFNLESPLVPLVVAAIFFISLVASIHPLIRNVRRSPIRDMRDE